ncbi:MAG TPA: hypothetical protein PKC30_12560 [Saprospiraceae bacterium]|nr:hypothetical protein [Saprospiraceae bacterium]
MRITHPRRHALNRYGFDIAIILILTLYVIFCLTPSSYGLVLNIFGYEEVGLYWGKPRPIRSDEWVVSTPYFQAAVNNGFERYNLNSIYREDFRGFYSFPIADWGLIFKPLVWPFFFLPSDYAFSLHHALVFLLFILGWKRLIEEVWPETRDRYISAILSLLLFFSGFMQGWLTTYGPLLAVTPWLFIVLFSCKNFTVRNGLVFFYVATVFILSHLYPPIIISTVYFGLVLVWVYKREVFKVKTLLGLGIAGMMALLTVYLYLKEPIAIMSQTVYPGQRYSNGGGVDFLLWISTFFPYINHTNLQPLGNINICELGVVTSYLPLMALIFSNHREWGSIKTRVFWIFSACIILMSLWMLLPVPQWAAKWILLDRVPGERMLWAFGLTVNFLAIHILLHSAIRFSAFRIGLFILLLLAGYTCASYIHNIPIGQKSGWELLAGVLLFIPYLLRKSVFRDQNSRVMSLIGTAMIINVIYFGFFNPGQSAQPIFSLKNDHQVDLLRNYAEDQPEKSLAAEGFPGAILQGLGIPSVSHVLLMPQLHFFRNYFPDIPDEEFNLIFNRYAHIHLSDVNKPQLVRTDGINIPSHLFNPMYKKAQTEIQMLESEFTHTPAGGHIDGMIETENHYILYGWGMMGEDVPEFYSNADRNIPLEIRRSFRHDVSRALNDDRLLTSGFQIYIPKASVHGLTHWCLFSKDNEFGMFKLNHSRTIPFQCDENAQK